MRIAVPTETVPGERRVAIVPDSVGALAREGHEVRVQAGAGTEAGFLDRSYREAGAAVVESVEELLHGAEVVAKVQPPTPPEVERLPRAAVLVSLLDPLGDPGGVRRLAEAGLTAFSLEMVPRTTRAQRMDVLSSQATVAGYKAVLTGADALPRLLPMLMTAAGTLRPGKVLVLGAGVAGLQAIATARRLGARVEAFDVRPEVREQVESLGATFLEAEKVVQAAGEGGYARELDEEEHRRELELIGAHVPDADLVVTTAQIPGRRAPLLLTRQMVESMRPGAVIVDLASESGGNCELSRSGETVVHGGVRILAPVNLPASLPFHASQMFSKNVAAFLEEMTGEGGSLAVDLDNDVLGPACVAHDGEIRSERVRALLEEAEDARGRGKEGSDG